MHTHARHLDKVISSRVPTRIASPRHVAPGTWSIGIYAGRSPLQLAPLPRIINPVLTAWHVTDVPAQFVADPFMLQSGSMWYMFFQVMNAVSRKGEIGLATSRNGSPGQYKQLCLNESFSVSFPCGFRSNDDFYMAPQSTQPGAVLLYPATSSPHN